MINVCTMVKTYSCGYPRDLGSPSAMRLLFASTTKYKDNDSGTGGGCSVVLVVSP